MHETTDILISQKGFQESFFDQFKKENRPSRYYRVKVHLIFQQLQG
jgi:hypothetical protein